MDNEQKNLYTSFRRLTNKPLDPTSIFETYEDAEKYLNSKLAYRGQVIAIVGDDEKKNGLYVIGKHQEDENQNVLIGAANEDEIKDVLDTVKTELETELANKISKDELAEPGVIDPNKAARYDDSGHLKGNAPESDNDLANKKYVDEMASGVKPELEKKLDKITELTSNDQLYSKDKAGNQVMVDISYIPVTGAIPKYYEDGRLKVSDPVDENDAMSLKYFKNHLSNNLLEADTSVSAYDEVYGKTTEGKQKMFSMSVAPTGDTIAYRDVNGRLKVGHPLDDSDATNKEYVDTSLNSKLDKNTTLSDKDQVYISGMDGSQSMRNLSTKPEVNAIPVYSDHGSLIVDQLPTDNSDATSKYYVDAEIESAVKNLNETKLDKTGGEINGNLAIKGNFSVSGTVTSKDTITLQVKDNIIVTNADKINLVDLSGFAINKNADETYGIMYDPGTNSVKLGLGSISDEGKFSYKEGEGSEILVRDSSSSLRDGELLKWNSEGNKLVSSGKTISDLEGKLDRVDSSDENARVYAIAKNGTNYSQIISAEAKVDSLALRNDDGTLTASTPTKDEHLATKGYVDLSTVKSVITSSSGTVSTIQNTQDGGLMRVDGSNGLSSLIKLSDGSVYGYIGAFDRTSHLGSRLTWDTRGFYYNENTTSETRTADDLIVNRKYVKDSIAGKVDSSTERGTIKSEVTHSDGILHVSVIDSDTSSKDNLKVSAEGIELSSVTGTNVRGSFLTLSPNGAFYNRDASDKSLTDDNLLINKNDLRAFISANPEITADSANLNSIKINGITYKLADPTIDDALNLESLNAVQNKVVTAAINSKLDSSEELKKLSTTLSSGGAGFIKKNAAGEIVYDQATYALSEDLTSAEKSLSSKIDEKVSTNDLNTKIQSYLTDNDYITSSDKVSSANRSDVADQIAHSITFGEKVYDGTNDVSISAADLGALTNVPTASPTQTGGIKVGYEDSGNNYGVKLTDEGQAYITVNSEIYEAKADGGLKMETEGNKKLISVEKVKTDLIEQGDDELILYGGNA